MNAFLQPMNRKGSVSLVVLFAMIAVLGLGAIVIDGGMLYHEKAKLQTAVDAAVLAGARELKNGSVVAHQVALETAQANGVSSSEVSITVDQTNQRVWAHATRSVDLGLARVLNFSRADVQATSEAGSYTVSALRGAAPLGVVWQDFIFGQLYDLKVGDGTTGNYGALALGGTGSAVYRENLRYGYAGLLSVGDLILTETGNMSGPTKAAIDDRLRDCNHYPECTWQQFASSCPRVLLVPIIDGIPNGRGEVTILGFAAFFVEGTTGGGNESYIRGRFIEMFVSGEAGPAGDYGAHVVRLLR